MRKHALGAAVSRDHNSTPRFSAKAQNRTTEKVDEAKTMVMSWFPTWKGQSRMVPLRHFNLIPLATILEADPEVDSWSVAGEDSSLHREGDQGVGPFTFLAAQGAHRVVFRVLQGSVRSQPEGGSDRSAMKGYSFISVHAKDLAADARLPAARDILYHRLADLPDGFLFNALTELSGEDSPSTLGELHARCAETIQVGWNHIVALLGLGHLTVRIDAGLDGSTAITGYRLEGYVQ